MAAILNTGVPVCIYKGFLPNASTLLYSVATGKILIVTECLLTNKDSVKRTPRIRAHTSDTAGYAIHEAEMGIGEQRNLALGTAVFAGENIYGYDGGGGGAIMPCRITGMLYDAPA